MCVVYHEYNLSEVRKSYKYVEFILCWSRANVNVYLYHIYIVYLRPNTERERKMKLKKRERKSEWGTEGDMSIVGIIFLYMPGTKYCKNSNNNNIDSKNKNNI